MTYEELRDTFPTNSLVTADDAHPGVWRVNQSVGLDGYLHLAPHDEPAVTALGGCVSLIIHAENCAPLGD